MHSACAWDTRFGKIILPALQQKGVMHTSTFASFALCDRRLATLQNHYDLAAAFTLLLKAPNRATANAVQ